ncbi:alpha/beta hydrolase [Methanolobus sp. ZRKC5]|uniref:alpha/beta fold hydrolase n=1 Tax=unclassified Methanolobus TaxID=2629569 RepID=UPI00313DF011
MKLRPNLILTSILITLALSGCIGIESENIQHDYSIYNRSTNCNASNFSIVDSPVKYVSVNGIETGYREFGSGEPLLMIMPFATKMDMCNASFVKQLSSGYRVILFDNRGMGYSSDNNEPLSISLLVNDTAGLMDTLGLDSVHIFGSSMGSVIAQELTLAHPEKVNRLILSSTTYSLDAPEANILKSKLQYRSTDPDTNQILRKYAQANLKWNGTYERLPEIQNKVLLLSANKDALTPPDISIKMAQNIPDAKFVRFDGGGHLGEQYLPEEYANEILSFLASE